MHVSTTWALACAEAVQQCPGMTWQVEARLLDSRVAYKMTVDHSSRQPVFFPVHHLAGPKKSLKKQVVLSEWPQATRVEWPKATKGVGYGPIGGLGPRLWFRIRAATGNCRSQ